MSAQLSADSRIHDIIHVLADPVEYNGIVVVHGYDPETSVVRFGITAPVLLQTTGLRNQATVTRSK